MLNQCAAALDPVAAVAIDQIVQSGDLRAVNVATHHSINAATSALVCHRLLEVADVLHGVLDLVLQESSQRPVRQVESSPHSMDKIVNFEQVVVQPRPEDCDGSRTTNNTVELIA